MWTLRLSFNQLAYIFYPFSLISRSPIWKHNWPTLENLRPPMVLCPKTFSWEAMTNTQRTTWRGSPSTWRRLLPAEEAPPRGEVDHGLTQWGWEIFLAIKPAPRSVLRQVTSATVTLRFLSMGKKERPQGMDRSWARFTTTDVGLRGVTEEMRRPFLTKLSWITVAITSVSVAAESRSISRHFCHPTNQQSVNCL